MEHDRTGAGGEGWRPQVRHQHRGLQPHPLGRNRGQGLAMRERWTLQATMLLVRSSLRSSGGQPVPLVLPEVKHI